MADRIRAAGGVVWRRDGGRLQVAVVHRPRYDDWSLPKGKLDDGETTLAAAVREVREELGSEVAVSRRLGHTSYTAAGVPKKVTYWTMRHRSGEFVAGDEVDEARWLPVRAARELVSYAHDRAMLAEFATLPTPDSVVVLVRHAKAGKRSEWRGDDARRPLDLNGERQARHLASLLACFAPTRVYSADRVRCVDTVRPLADALGVDVRIDPVFNDESYEDAPGATRAALLALGRPGKVSVVCSQGVTIPALIDRLGPGIRSSDTRKGAWWTLSLVDGEVIAVDHYSAP